MARTHRKSAGSHPKPPKATRKELDIAKKASIVTLYTKDVSEHQIAKDLDVKQPTVHQIIHKAKERAKTTSTPLQDITNLQNTPRTGQKRRITDDLKIRRARDLGRTPVSNDLRKTLRKALWIGLILFPHIKMRYTKNGYNLDRCRRSSP